MAFATVENDVGHVTIVNTDHITFLRYDNYGTAVHFSSGEHIVCPTGIEVLVDQLRTASPEAFLIRSKQ